MSNPKVFEFAKEIGMETLVLMDKIREWKLPVKSHMAELGADVLEEIKNRLSEEKQAADKRKKGITIKRKVIAKQGDLKQSATVVKKKITTVRKTKAQGSDADGETVATAATAEALAKRSTVLRRKSQVAEDQEQEVKAASVMPEEIPEEANFAEPSVLPLEEEPNELVETPLVGAAQQIEVASAEVPTGTVSEVVPEPAPPEAPPRKVLKRKNIVGRMDLSRVAPPSSYGGGANQAGAGAQYRTPRTGAARSIRTGFVAAPPMPMEPIREDREARRRDTRDVRKSFVVGAAPPAAGEATREEEVPEFSSADFRKREMVFQPKKKKAILNREALKTQITRPKASKRVIKIFERISVQDLAQELGVKIAQVTKMLMNNGVMARPTTEVDYETASLVAQEFEFEVLNVQKSAEEMLESAAFGDLAAERTLRSPVVTVMGHVDHGKTTLLDAIRNTNVAAGEQGGITQHIGAYQVHLPDGRAVTFIDTPGHEAFTAMRARGAQVTDIAVIVVAADDGIMPQTIEAVNHAKAAGVQIIVAINKMDRPNANPDRVKQQLAEHELVPEEWGGQTMYCAVSALKRQGIDELLERIHLLAEMGELRANAKRSGTGIVIESKVEKGRGNVATILVQDGTVRVGEAIVVGQVSGRVRGLLNDKGKNVKEAGPSMPVQVLGLSDSPMAGDRFDVCKSEAEAQKIAEFRREQAEKERAVEGAPDRESLFAKLLTGNLKELPVILKTDVAGSIEAIRGMFSKLGNQEVKPKIIHAAVGGITESDILLAKTSNSLVVGFNVRPDSGALAAAKANAVTVKTYGIVYELIDDMKKALSGLLEPEIVEKILGRVEVRETFVVPKIGTIAGCFVIDGKILRSCQVRLLREGRVIYTGRLASLRRFKDDVKEVAMGYECGMGIENYNDIKVGDEIEAFVEEKVLREL